MPSKTRNGIHHDSLMIHPLAMLTTPYDIAFNRMKESMVSKHGSCGLGVGATMKRCIETPYKTFTQDLRFPKLLEQKLKSVREYYLNLISANSRSDIEYNEMLNSFYSYLEKDELEEIFMDDIFLRESTLPFTVTNIDVREYSNIVFEGSQGIMLDMDHGIFPNVTYANTTSKNAFRFCKERGLRITDIHYVTRCYTTRHGEGWMPNETPVELINTKEEINVHNDWQGGFRIGEIDYESDSTEL
jgi:adenylosuccinate synthase